MKKIILTAAVCLGGYVSSQGQVSLTIEKAMDIAEEHSPSLRRSHMNLERYQPSGSTDLVDGWCSLIDQPFRLAG